MLVPSAFHGDQTFHPSWRIREGFWPAGWTGSGCVKDTAAGAGTGETGEGAFTELVGSTMGAGGLWDLGGTSLSKDFWDRKGLCSFPGGWNDKDGPPSEAAVSSRMGWRLPGLEEAGGRMLLALKLCSLCVKMSLGLKDLWETSDFASWEKTRKWKTIKTQRFVSLAPQKPTETRFPGISPVCLAL